MKEKTPAAGDPIEARCTKCRKITNHTIVAMNEEKPARVECNTCKGQHLYRKPKATAQSAAEKKAADTKVALKKKWADLESELQGSKAQEYSMDSAYKTDTVIRHSQFGLGQIQRIIGARKMEVLFEDGLKMMRCK